MNDDLVQFEQRKQDHIQLALLAANQASECNPFDRMVLIHEAIPDFNFDEIDIQSRRFGQAVLKPFIVSSMTAGHVNAVSINERLMQACLISGWAMGVGSQRRELMDKAAANEWKVLRSRCEGVALMGNLGMAQLITTTDDDIARLIDNLHAKALIVHCNPLQEVMQPEGTPFYHGAWHRLAALVASLPVPVVVKETGCGFSAKTLQRLNDIGVAAIDVSGLGGTHWGRIEGCRATDDPIRQMAASTFKNWGIDTVTSVQTACALTPSAEVWGSGGVRHGLDAAKLFALGASTVGFAKPMLEAALISAEAVIEKMNAIEYELKVAMFCTGSKTLSGLLEAVCR